jgi:hypothetical protein
MKLDYVSFQSDYDFLSEMARNENNLRRLPCLFGHRFLCALVLQNRSVKIFFLSSTLKVARKHEYLCKSWYFSMALPTNSGPRTLI